MRPRRCRRCRGLAAAVTALPAAATPDRQAASPPTIRGRPPHRPPRAVGATLTTSHRSKSTTGVRVMAKAAALRKPKKKVNPLDKEGIAYIDYKDVALLRKFISDRGKIRARRVTGVSSQQQRQIASAVKNAREMALLPYTTTAR